MSMDRKSPIVLVKFGCIRYSINVPERYLRSGIAIVEKAFPIIDSSYYSLRITKHSHNHEICGMIPWSFAWASSMGVPVQWPYEYFDASESQHKPEQACLSASFSSLSFLAWRKWTWQVAYTIQQTKTGRWLDRLNGACQRAIINSPYQIVPISSDRITMLTKKPLLGSFGNISNGASTWLSMFIQIAKQFSQRLTFSLRCELAFMPRLTSSQRGRVKYSIG
jgi:hypothetical protein